MSLRRSLSWSNALIGIREDRIRLPAGVLSAKSYAESLARIRKQPLVTAAGAYDRAAIMTFAAAAAKLRQGRTGEPWKVCMAAALKGAWIAAQHARARAAH